MSNACIFCGVKIYSEDEITNAECSKCSKEKSELVEVRYI